MRVSITINGVSCYVKQGVHDAEISVEFDQSYYDIQSRRHEDRQAVQYVVGKGLMTSEEADRFANKMKVELFELLTSTAKAWLNKYPTAKE